LIQFLLATGGGLSLMQAFGVNPKIQDCEIWPVLRGCTGSDPVEKES